MRLTKLTGVFFLVSAGTVFGSTDTDFEECLLRELQSGDAERTAGSIKALCEEQTSLSSVAVTASPESHSEESAVELRRRSEANIEERDFAIMTYKPSYLLYTYNSEFDAENSIYAQVDSDFENLKKEEMKFQVSAKFPVWRNMLGSDTDMYFGYSQTSWWQLFADEGITSAPFRETNYEPELFVRHFTDTSLPLNGNLSALDLSLVHQSNGRSELLSRSWNRVMGRAVLDYDNVAILGRLWYRLPEDDEDDDNPNEYRYLGYGDIRAVWAPNKNTFTAMWRPGTEESGVEFTWSYPISRALRVYAQWWYGYGESLIDYDQKVNRFGIGVAVNDFLMRGD